MLLILILFLIPFPLSSYDDEVDKVNQYQRLSLEDLEKIEIGKFKGTPQVLGSKYCFFPEQVQLMTQRHSIFQNQRASPRPVLGLPSIL